MSSNVFPLDIVLNEIIDELNPHYRPTTDEERILEQEDFGIYQRAFRHSNGNEILVKWTVYYGTPETVKTVFHPIEEL